MRNKIWMSAAIILGLLFFAGWAVPQAGSQAASATDQPAVTVEQQKQLDQLRQLEDQLANDRAAVHEAIGKYGFDSDQVDAAREQLIRDRAQYREMRRSLVAAGVTVPQARGMGYGRSMAGQGRMGMRGRGMRGGRGQCQCPCRGY
jgi:predicted negative regulator of RcsB-dependent stress response